MWEGGDGPPIVLLAGEFAAVWMRVIPDLVTTHRVIAADLPDSGLRRVLATSCGGSTNSSSRPAPNRRCWSARASAAPSPRATRSRTATGSRTSCSSTRRGWSGSDRRPGMALTFVGVMLRPTERGLERSFRRYCFVDLDRVRARDGRAATTGWWRTPWTGSARRVSTPRCAAFEAPRAGDPEADLDRIAVPTTLIWGRHDVAAPLRIAETAAARRGWPLHVIEGARDDPAVEQPDAFLAALRSTACVPSTSRR